VETITLFHSTLIGLGDGECGSGEDKAGLLSSSPSRHTPSISDITTHLGFRRILMKWSS